MRMRKLEHTQSIKFFAPLEVHRQIVNLSPRSDTEIDSSDVVRWCLRQTQELSKRSEPLWFIHGFGYAQRSYTCNEFVPMLNASESLGLYHLQEWSKALLETEAQTLSEMYGLREGENPSLNTPWLSSTLAAELTALRHSRNIETARQRSVAEEQEREIAREVEQEKEVQRPPGKDPLRHELSLEVQHFAVNGFIRSLENGCILPAYEVLRRTSVQPHVFDASHFPGVHVTRDFARAVHIGEEEWTDDFLRPVRWIISNKASTRLLIVSPFEAKELINILRQSKCTALHLYSPRTSRNMISFSDLQFCVVSQVEVATLIPQMASLVLNLFS